MCVSNSRFIHMSLQPLVCCFPLGTTAWLVHWLAHTCTPSRMESEAMWSNLIDNLILPLLGEYVSHSSTHIALSARPLVLLSLLLTKHYSKFLCGDIHVYTPHKSHLCTCNKSGQKEPRVSGNRHTDSGTLKNRSKFFLYCLPWDVGV